MHRSVRVVLPFILCVGFVGSAPAQEAYPSRPVELVVPFSPGGGTDLMARLLADGLTKRLGQTVVVLNRPGANTNVGTQAVVRSKPDGYTLVMASLGLAANPSLYKRLPFQPLRDLAPVTLITSAPTVLVAPTSLPANSVSEFVALLKAKPGEINFGTFGVGSGPHLAAELFMDLTDTKMVHVPFSGGGQGVNAVIAGTVQAMFSSPLPVLGAIKNGTLKAIAIASDRRSPLLPDVPTFTEAGIPYRTGTWFGVLAPAATPPAVIATLNKAAIETLRDPSVKGKIEDQGGDVVANSPDEFRDFIKNETERLAKVIRNANIQID
jgi:tripartite-type tricarboxylate transporter receptor subunit TctC